MQGLVLIGESTIYEVIFAEERMLNVIGCLEYDPDMPGGKADYREHLENTVVFKEAVPIGDANILAQIHQTYRIQYLKDVILSKVPDDVTQSTLATYIMFNGVEIVERLHADGKFTVALVKQLKESTSIETQRDLVSLLKAYCALGKTLQTPPKLALLRALIAHGIFEVLGSWLRGDVFELKKDALEILRTFHMNMDLVRGSILNQHKGGDNAAAKGGVKAAAVNQTILHDLVQCFAGPTTRSLVVQSCEIITRIMATEEMDAREGGNKSKLLAMFYEECMDTFTSSLNPGESGLPTLADIAAHERVNYTLGFLTTYLSKHTYHIKNYLISKFSFFNKIIPVLKCRQVVLVLAALRVLRAMVGLQNGGNEFYNRQMVKHSVFKPIVEELQHNGAQNSLLQSCILELFEHVRVKKIKSLLSHIVETHRDALCQMPWALTPKQLIDEYEKMQDSSYSFNGSSGPAGRAAAAADGEDDGSGGGAARLLHARGSLSDRFRRDGTMDERQEDYFSETTDDDDDAPQKGRTVPFGMVPLGGGGGGGGGAGAATKPASSEVTPVGHKELSADADADADADGDADGERGGSGSSEPPTFRKRRMLVDYDSDEDDEDDFTTGVKKKNSANGIFSGGGGNSGNSGLAKRQKFPASISKSTISFTGKFTLATAKDSADDGGTNAGGPDAASA